MSGTYTLHHVYVHDTKEIASQEVLRTENASEARELYERLERIFEHSAFCTTMVSIEHDEVIEDDLTIEDLIKPDPEACDE